MRSTFLIAAAAVAALMSGEARAADPAHGQAIFKVTCALCHVAQKGASPSELAVFKGPNLWGVVGRKAGTFRPYSYSYAMRSSGITWTDDQLRRYITSPQTAVPNVRMSFLGLKNPRDREDMIAFLNTMH